MRDLKIYVAAGSLFLIIYLIAQYNKPKPADWTPTYSKNDKIPYGTYLLFQRINDIVPGCKILSRRKPVYNVFKEEQINPGNYVIIAGSVNLDKYDFGELIKYMNAGNNVFIATYNLGNFLSDTLKARINSEIKIGSKNSFLQFTNPVLNPAKKYVFDREIGDQYFSKFDTAHAVVLGKNDKNHSNFLMYPFGKGALYLISSPQFFTNYNLLNVNGADYAAKALSYLQPSGDLIWDEYASSGPEEESSLMRVFFKHPELNRAYNIALFSLVIFVLFEMKRRQRIIPVIDPLKNTSAEFVKVVGQVYYEQRDNKNIARKKVSYLLEHIRTVYRLNTNIVDEEFITTLSNKSGIELSKIRIMMHVATECMESVTIKDEELINLNNYIEEFYKRSK